jgi:hypothetical protein
MRSGQLKQHFNLIRRYPEMTHNRAELLYIAYPQRPLNNLAVLFFLVA